MTASSTAIGQRVALDRARPGTTPRQSVNVGEIERWTSVLGGGLLAATGLARGGVLGLVAAGLGGSLIYRGMTGHCYLYQSLGVNTSSEKHSPVASVAAGAGVKVTEAVTINRPASDIYRFWRNLANLPRVMRHLETVRVDGDRSHWVAHGPLGHRVEWDAEIINDRPNELIAWRSLEGSEVGTAGSVHFQPAPGGRGTEVHVTLKYDPPLGKVGSWAAWFLGEEPSLQIREDLLRLKQLMETGEIATTTGQPAGRR
jgi:uncharacterized membrane protein